MNRYGYCRVRRAALLIVLIATPRLSTAQPGPDRQDCESKVTPEQKQTAQALLKQAYEHHKELRFEQVTRLYREALAHWDHPEIRLGLGRVLFDQARLLEAHEQVSLAVQCPDKLESKTEREQAETLLSRLRSQLAEIVVHAPDASAEIWFNGGKWFTGTDGRMRRRVVYPGQYVITARQPAHIPVNRPIELRAGNRATITPTLASVEDATTVQTRWARWKPWAVIGAGVATGLIGAGLQLKAAADFRAFDDAWDDACTHNAVQPGCSERDQSELLVTLRRAHWEQRSAIGALVVGGAVLTAGLTMLGFNRSRSYRNDAASSTTLEFTPLVSPHVAGVSAGRWF